MKIHLLIMNEVVVVYYEKQVKTTYGSLDPDIRQCFLVPTRIFQDNSSNRPRLLYFITFPICHSLVLKQLDVIWSGTFAASQRETYKLNLQQKHSNCFLGRSCGLLSPILIFFMVFSKYFQQQKCSEFFSCTKLLYVISQLITKVLIQPASQLANVTDAQLHGS